MQRPSIATNVGKKTWKNLDLSEYFIMQSHQSQKTKEMIYRIITRTLPKYKVAYHENIDVITEAWNLLHEVIVPSVPLQKNEKLTSKKIVKFIKFSYKKNKEKIEYDHTNENFLSDAEAGSMEELFEDESSSPRKSSSDISLSEDDDNDMDADEEEFFFEPFEDFDELQQKNKKSNDDKYTENSNFNNSNKNLYFFNDTLTSAYSIFNKLENFKDDNYFTRFKVFINLLRLPEPALASKKSSLNTIRETNLVKQRRLVLSILTIFLLLVRLCSFDFFIFLLIFSNCCVLYFLKNSRSINVQMAKRSVKQRVGWAKQYLGGLMSKTDSRSGVEDIMGIPDNEKNRKVSNSSLKSKRRLLRLGKRKSDPLVSTSMNNFDNINVNNNVNLTLPNASTTLNNNQIEKKNSSTWTREHNNNVPAITILGIPASKSQQSDTGSKEHLSTSPNTINLVSNNTTQNVKAKKNLNIFHRNKNSNANNSNNITNLAASSNENPFIVRKSISSGCLKEGKPILDLEEDYLQNEFYHQIDSS